MKPLLILLFLASTAHAEMPEQLTLTLTARNLARDGRCEALPAIADRVRALDPDYYTHAFVLDPVIASCIHVDAHRQLGLPPSLTPHRIATHDLFVEPKNPDTALGLSLGFTAGGVGLLVAAGATGSAPLAVAGVTMTAIGPTTGHIYAGHTLNAGLGTRAVGALLTVIGTGIALPCLDRCSQGTADVGAVLLLGGGITYTVGSLYEIATAPEAAQRFNREHGFEATVVPTGNGLALAGTF